MAVKKVQCNAKEESKGMSKNRSDHDFDWMTDYLVCSVAYAFDLLKTEAKGATDTYSKAYNQEVSSRS